MYTFQRRLSNVSSYITFGLTEPFVYFIVCQEQVDNGIPLRLCLRKFSHWLDKLQREKGLVFDPPSEDSTEASYTTFVTWSGMHLM